MLNKRLQLTIALITIVVCTALEEITPAFLRVGFPFLLVAAMKTAESRCAVAAVFFAVGSGACEDAVSSLPPLTSVGFFLAVVFAVRKIPVPKAVMYAAYPLYQLWLAVWIPEIDGGVILRTLCAVPVGALTLAVFSPLLGWLDRKAGVDEQG